MAQREIDIELQILTPVELARLAGSECAVCFEGYGLEMEIAITYCGHVYHARCLRTWLDNVF